MGLLDDDAMKRISVHRVAAGAPVVMVQAGPGVVTMTVHASEGTGTFGGSWTMSALEVPEFCRVLEAAAAVALDDEQALRGKENRGGDGR